MMKKYFLAAVCVMFLACGCAAFEPYADEQGNAHTKIEDYLNKAGEVAGMVGSTIPGTYAIAGGAAMLLSLVGNGITTFMARRRGNTLSAVINGVEIAADNYDKLRESVLQLFKDDKERYDKLERLFASGKPIKEIIKQIAEITNTEHFLNKAVRRTT